MGFVGEAFRDGCIFSLVVRFIGVLYSILIAESNKKPIDATAEYARHWNLVEAHFTSTLLVKDLLLGCMAEVGNLCRRKCRPGLHG